ncbi:ATP-binding protein [Microbacterium sp. NPDC055683]
MSDLLIAGYDDETAQWRARHLQVVNWGGFHGHHRVDFDRDATLISGGSGTGKSTLLDAYIALMMPSTIPFNGASNDATVGRARGADQRNILTYLRGKRDTVRDVERVLRGDGTSAWGAISMTFVDGSGRHYTALRTYWAPAGAQRSTEVRSRHLTYEGDIDLSELAAFADGRFDPRALRARYAGMRYHETTQDFLYAVAARLGIGEGGNSDNALRLLARIQAGHQVRTVDRLYKEMVLEEPPTYAAADAVLAQFQALAQSHESLSVNAAKERMLGEIAHLHGDWEAARTRVARLDRYGLARPDEPTPFRLWKAQAEYRLLGEAEEANKAAREAAREAVTAARAAETALAVEVEELKEQRAQNGGDLLARLDARIAEGRARAERVADARRTLQGRVEVLGATFPTRDAFRAVKEAAADYLETAGPRLAELKRLRDEEVLAVGDLVRKRRADAAELDSLSGRESLIPDAFDRARRDIAQAAGLDPSELPFAAELMDVHPDFEPWRTAAEVTLSGIGMTLLMDARRQQHVREAIETLRLGRRIRFDGVDLQDDAEPPSDDRYISGRLVFRDSPFTAWVKRRVAASDHLCVGSAAELGGDAPKVTVNGQVSQGRRGAAGRDARERHILGFSNDARRREIETEIEATAARIAEHETTRAEHERATDDVQRVAEAYRRIQDAEWASIDVDAVTAEVAELEAQRAAILEKSDLLGELAERLSDAETRLEEARGERFGHAGALDALERAWGAIVDRQDAVATLRDALAQGAELSEDDARHLDRELVRMDPEVDHESFEKVCARLADELQLDVKRAAATLDSVAASLERIFAAYNEKWPDPNRGTTVEAYDEFAAIYAEITRDGLSQHRLEFRRHLQEVSTMDLKMLSDSFGHALLSIEERLEPVNDILRHLDFASDTDRLRIDMRHLHPERIEGVKAQLKALSAPVEGDWSDEEADRRFAQLQEFIDLIELPESGVNARRDEILDVRRHIEITASRIAPDGQEVSTYSTLGDKSGGESQELVAFIVGAALRYQLGDQTRSWPRFAPVFLDEGFVKADSAFTGRAIKAWLGLGFQIVVVAPLDKVNTLEPHMGLNLSVTKNAAGYSFITAFRDAA